MHAYNTFKWLWRGQARTQKKSFEEGTAVCTIGPRWRHATFAGRHFTSLGSGAAFQLRRAAFYLLRATCHLQRAAFYLLMVICHLGRVTFYLLRPALRVMWAVTCAKYGALDGVFGGASEADGRARCPVPSLGASGVPTYRAFRACPVPLDSGRPCRAANRRKKNEISANADLV